MAGIPQVITEDRASGAQFIDGSLLFDGSTTYLTRTPVSVGNRKTFTISFWAKRNQFSLSEKLYQQRADTNSSQQFGFQFRTDGKFRVLDQSGGSTVLLKDTTRVFRDLGWYHIVVAVDTTDNTAEDRCKIYVNGVRETSFSSNTNYSTQNYETSVNTTDRILIGASRPNSSSGLNSFVNGSVTQYYLIDGLALGPGYFGYTDPLTNTWRPKKFKAEGTTVNDGTVFSSTGTFTGWNTGAYPKTELFDGVLYTGSGNNGASAASSSDPASFDFGDQRITGFQNLKINIFISSNQANGTNLVSVNGVDITEECHAAGNNTWTTVDLGNKFTTLQSFSIPNYYVYVGGFIIDGVVMKDGITQNLGYNGDVEGFGGVTWSSYITGSVDSSYGSAADLFNGTIPTGTTGAVRSTNPGTLTLSIASVNLNVANVKLHTYIYNTPSTFQVNGVTIDRSQVSGNGDKEFTIAVNGQLNSIAWSYDSGSGPYCYMRGIEVDLGDGNGYQLLTDGAGGAAGVNGFHLPMDGSAPIGKDLSQLNPINDGTVWSSYINGSDYNSGHVKANMFNGSTTGQYLAGSSSSVTITFPGSGLDFSSSLRIMAQVTGGSSNIVFNWSGGSHTEVITAVGAVWWDVSSDVTSPVTSITWTSQGGAAGPYINALEVDGVILHDNTYGNGWTPVNFGGSVALDNPQVSGARPILNTLPGGTQAKSGVFGSNEGFTETVSSSSGSGNPYIFDGRGTQPTLSFIRGATYVFDYSSATSHPLRFATAADAAGSTEYTTGTSISGNVISFTVPHDAPATLYYYCANHSGMGNSISITTDETKADKYASNCVLAMPFLGNVNDVSNQINVTSTTKVATNDGSTPNSSNSQFYGGSTNFDGSDDRITIPYSADFTFDGDFTIEYWIFREGSGIWLDFADPSDYTNGYQFYYAGGNILFYVNSTSGTQVAGTGYFDVPASKWTHHAVCREGNNCRVYENGILKRTTNLPGTLGNNTSNVLQIGAQNYNGPSGYYDGKLSDLRIYKGVAKYTSDFVVPATNPDILPDTPSGVISSPQLTKITDGAVNFNIDDYLFASDNADLELGGNDFTIEAYIYPNGTPGSSSYNCIFCKGESLQCYFMSNGAVTLFASTNYSTSNYNIISGNVLPAGSVSLNRWHHVAICRSGNTWKVFLDGVEKYSGTHSGSIEDNAYGFAIGDYYPSAGTYDFQGFISNFRVVNGTAIYTSDFTPPTEPLTAVTNTKLLCCQSPTSAIAAAVSPGSYTLTGVNYSSGSQVTGSAGLTRKDSIFNGYIGGYLNYSSYATNSTSSDNYILWTPTTPISYSSKVEIYCYAANGYSITNTYSLNGGSEQSFTGGSANFNDHAWITVATGSGTLNSLKVRLQRGGGNASAVAWNAVRVDGTILVNDFYGSPLLAYGSIGTSNFNPLITDINAFQGPETSYCTLNPLDKRSNVTLSNGNLDVTTTNSHWSGVKGTLGVNSGKYYFEEIADGPDANKMFFGICASNVLIDPSSYVQDDTTERSKGMLIFCDNGNYQLDANTRTTYSSQLSDGDVLGIALDLDGNTVEFYKNGTALGSIDISSSPLATTTVVPLYVHYNSNTKYHLNFGQKPFKFPPPDGFQSLNLANIRPETVIARPDQFVSPTLYTGDGSTGRSITGLNFNAKPDLVWIKKRNASSDHRIFDSVRGATNVISPNNPSAETTNNAVTSFENNGWSASAFNNDGDTYVAWSWKAGGSKNTFNVDDVGYANASDVGMNVGGKNSSVYNQDRVWSSGVTLSNGGFDDPITNAFNGNSANRARSAADAPLMTITFNPAVTIGSSLFIQTESTYNAASYAYTATIDGTTYSQSDNYDTTFSQTGSLTQITIDNNDAFGRTYLELIKIDGKELVDSGVTPAINVPLTAATGCSVGTKQGFSIVSYTSAAGDGVSSVPHGLSQTPDFVVIKNRDTAASSQGWPVWHSAVPDKSRYLDSTNAWDATEFGHFFNSVAPNSGAVTVRANSAVSSGNRYRSYGNGDDFIMYCWHSVPGLQKFSSYTSTGTTSGPFVELGFRPALLWIKNSARNGEEWVVYDNERQSHNPNGATLYINNNAQEYDGNSTTGGNSRYVDFLSNGFKINDVGNPINISGQEEVHIYCAWAEAPAFNLYGAQSNAR